MEGPPDENRVIERKLHSAATAVAVRVGGEDPPVGEPPKR